MAAFDLRSASLHLSEFIETSSSYQNTKTLLHFYDPMVIIVSPSKLAPDGMVGVSELVDRFYSTIKKVMPLKIRNYADFSVCVCVRVSVCLLSVFVHSLTYPHVST